jgi:ATP-dependent 26S proteasome regulatory subunit
MIPVRTPTNDANSDFYTNLIFITLISSLIGIITKNLENVLNAVPHILQYISTKILKLFFKKHIPKGEVIIEGRKFSNTNGVTNFELSTSYKAIFHKIMKNKINIDSIIEVLSSASYWGGNNVNNYIVNETSSIINLDKDVKANFKFQRNVNASLDPKQEASKEDKIILIVSSSKYQTHELLDIISDIEREYIKDKRVNDNGDLYFIRKEIDQQTKDLDTKSNNKNKYHLHVLNTYKAFNNIFFEDKKTLLKKTDYFLNNENEYKRKGIPYSLGFLFFGEPGCGKTSCIKALANYTKRHVVEINLNSIRTCSEFIQQFQNENYNETYIPSNKKIIILEDIDCMAEIVQSRKKHDERLLRSYSNTNDFSDNSDSDINTATNSSSSSFCGPCVKWKPDKDKDKLTLSCILNTIDGVYEQYGLIVVITTNYVDRLDEALIRPGRIDVKINFTKCTKKMFYDIVEHFYDKKINKDIIFEDNKYSPAEIIDKCFLHNEDIEKLLNEFNKINE